jgi:hypothetical protein
VILHQWQRTRQGQIKRAHLSPVFKTDFEDLSVVNCRNLDQVVMGVQEEVLHIVALDQTKMDAQKVSQEEGQVVDELLLVV